MAEEKVFGLSLRFIVTVDGQPLGSWSKCDGLSVEFDVKEVKEGGNNAFIHRLPGRAKYQNIKLTRPLDKSTSDVAKWLATVAANLKRSTAKIAVLDTTGHEVASWSLVGVYPAKWTGPTLDVGQNQVATESLELVHNGFGG